MTTRGIGKRAQRDPLDTLKFCGIQMTTTPRFHFRGTIERDIVLAHQFEQAHVARVFRV